MNPTIVWSVKSPSELYPRNSYIFSIPAVSLRLSVSESDIGRACCRVICSNFVLCPSLPQIGLLRLTRSSVIFSQPCQQHVILHSKWRTAGSRYIVYPTSSSERSSGTMSCVFTGRTRTPYASSISYAVPTLVGGTLRSVLPIRGRAYCTRTSCPRSTATLWKISRGTNLKALYKCIARSIGLALISLTESVLRKLSVCCIIHQVLCISSQ